MKNALKFAVIALVAVFISSCSAGNGPEKAAKAYLDALNAEDFEKAKEYVTEDTKGVLDVLISLSEMPGREKKETGAEKREIKDLKCSVIGDTTATCTYVVEDEVMSDNPDSAGGKKPRTEKLNLRKSGDKWLVHQPKEVPPGAGSPMPMQMPFDSTASEVMTDSGKATNK